MISLGIFNRNSRIVYSIYPGTKQLDRLLLPGTGAREFIVLVAPALNVKLKEKKIQKFVFNLIFNSIVLILSLFFPTF